jgi:hypothetical protein
MAKIKCKRSVYLTAKAGKLNVDASNVKQGMFVLHPLVFPTPPISEAILMALIITYNDAYSAYEKGGANQKGAYEAAKTALLNALDQLAIYVDSVADGDPNIITNAGFVATKGIYSKAPAPTQLLNIRLTRGAAGELFAWCEQQDYVDTYLCVLTAMAPLPPSMVINAGGQLFMGNSAGTMPHSGFIDMNKNRRKKFVGLNSGMIYYVTFIAVNAQGVSQMSVPVALLCG